ncbi:MAG: PfkB family carbohydrate kinase [Opitutales bacterium]|nr:PfkB family carbohydrate kinase [Opitutales bacterium]
MKSYDITFVGHMCYDEVTYYNKEGYTAPGSAVLCGAAVAARVGKKVALVTRLAKKDEKILDALKEVGVDCYVTYTDETSWMYVGHPSDNVEDRDMILKHTAGPFEISDFPEIETKAVHLAGISDTEFTLEFMQGLKDKGFNLSVDLQSFVRQAHPETKEVSYGDDDRKKEIVALMSKVKLDVTEANILTGTPDLVEASKIIAEWGCPEVLLTKTEGVQANVDGKMLWEQFSNKSVIGRTGRGDTTFAAYLSQRLDKEPEYALKYAASLVSLKMEKVGPYSGNHQDALDRMKADGRI